MIPDQGGGDCAHFAGAPKAGLIDRKARQSIRPKMSAGAFLSGRAQVAQGRGQEPSPVDSLRFSTSELAHPAPGGVRRGLDGEVAGAGPVGEPGCNVLVFAVGVDVEGSTAGGGLVSY